MATILINEEVQDIVTPSGPSPAPLALTVGSAGLHAPSGSEDTDTQAPDTHARRKVKPSLDFPRFNGPTETQSFYHRNTVLLPVRRRAVTRHKATKKLTSCRPGNKNSSLARPLSINNNKHT